MSPADTPEQLAYYYGGKRPMDFMGLRIDASDYHKRKRKCAVCGGTATIPIGARWQQDKPDMYEVQIGKEGVRREWSWCHKCKMIQQVGAINQKDAVRLYTDGYRSVKMRGNSVGDEFNRILREGQSENKARVDWILGQVKPASLLDIGSGLGLFPYEMRNRIEGLKIQCFEPNMDSHQFITEKLGISCEPTAYAPWRFKGMYDLISLVHVLEHIQRPDDFLREVSMDLGKWLYIEVPDAVEFEYLEPEHDEFNSTHHWFFSPAHLIQFLERCDFLLSSMQTITTERGLSRIMVLAKRKPRCFTMVY